MEVIVDSGFIDALIIGIGALVIALIIFLGIWAYQSHTNPKEARETKKAKTRKLQLMLLAGLGHFADLFSVFEAIPEGILETFPIGKGLKKKSLTFQLPRKTNADEIPLEVEEGKNEVLTRAVLQKVLDLNAEKVILRDARSPIMIGVQDKAVAAGIKGLGALAFIEKLERLSKIKTQIDILTKTDGFTELGKLLSDFYSQISLIDFNAIRTHFPNSYDQTIRDSLKERYLVNGQKQARNKDKDFKTLCLYMGILLIGVAALIAVVWLVTGK